MSDNALYEKDLATFGESTFDQMQAVGFIELFGLQSVLASNMVSHSSKLQVDPFIEVETLLE